MSRALLPWLVPAAMVAALLAGVSGSVVVMGLVLIAVVGVALGLLSAQLRSGDVPRMFRGDGTSDRDLPRWLRFGPDDRHR